MNLIKKGLESAEKKNEKVMGGIIKIWLAETMVKAKAFREYEMKKLAEEGIRILKKLQVKLWDPIGYMVLGEFFTELSQREKALQYLRIAEGMFKKMGMDYYLAKTREVLKRL